VATISALGTTHTEMPALLCENQTVQTVKLLQI